MVARCKRFGEAFLARFLEPGDYSANFTAWIKGNTDDRFFPYGNLVDRLKSNR